MSKMILLKTGLIFLFSVTVSAKNIFMFKDENINEIAEKLAEDVEYGNSITEIFEFHSKLATNNSLGFFKQLELKRATEEDWTKFLSNNGFTSKDKYLQKQKSLFDNHSSVLNKYLGGSSVEFKKKVLEVAAKIFVTKSKIIPECLTAWVLGVGYCTAMYELYVASGDPNALLYWSLCLATNDALYLLCELS